MAPNRKEEHLIGLIFVVAILLPHIGFLYIINPLLILYLGMRYSNQQKTVTQLLLVFIVCVSLIWNLLVGVNITSKSLIRAFYICEMMWFFPFCPSIRIPSLYLYFVSGTILLSQLCTILNIGPIISFFDSIYPPSGEFDWESSEYLVSHAEDANTLSALQEIRFGGIFHNPNRCMKYVSLCLVVFLVDNFEKPFIRILPFVLITITSSLLAGSRTGFVIVVISLLSFFYFRFNKGKSINLWSIIVPLSVSVLALIALSSILDLRVFRLAIGGARDGSISSKFSNLSDYLSRVDSLRALIVGNFSLESVKELYQTSYTGFDSEWGDAIYLYGFIWLIFYIAFLIMIVFNTKGEGMISLFILIWIVSSTVIISYRTSFAFMLILSKYYSSYRRGYPKSLVV